MKLWLRNILTPKRIALIVVSWGVLYVLLLWLDLHPQPLGLFGIVGFAILAHSAYASADTPWPAPDWHHASLTTRRPNRTDGRLRFIRRRIESAIDRQDPHSTDLNAHRMQEMLRVVTRDQLQARPGLRINTLAELRAAVGDQPSGLASYLFADPAPRLNLTQLQDLVKRIEEL